MTTPPFTAKPPNPTAPGNAVPSDFRLPDRPEREPDDMTSFDPLAGNGNVHHLREHLGNHDTTLVSGDRYIVAEPITTMAGSRYPDLLVAFDVNPAAYRARNGYIVSEQGKPPDFVLEIASRSTASVDVDEKPLDYAALGILEYWRYDETGEHHGARLAGDRLVSGRYAAIPIAELPDGSLQGYSRVLDLNLRWEAGELRFYDPATDRPIRTMEDEREARIAEREARITEQARADAAEARAAAEREARIDAEARVREMEELLRRQNL